MKYLLANFKTNKNLQSFQEYFDELTVFCNDKSIDTSKTIFFLNSFYSLTIKNKYNFLIGNQSGSALGNGAFTTSVSLEQLHDEKMDIILLGHSEEYKHFHQTFENVNQQIIKACSFGMKCFVCFGNQNEVSDSNQLANELFEQVQQLLKNVPSTQLSQIVLAYEPIYTIGTGKSMNPDEANIVSGLLKQKLASAYQYNLPVVYGGSVNLTNLSQFLSSNNLDGVLIGKESWDANKMKEMMLLNK